MIYDNYAEKSLLCNISVQGKTSGECAAYRGDMVVVEGEIADAQGRRHPPKSVVKQAVSLSDSDKIKMVAGALDEIESLPIFIEKYGDDFSDDIDLLFYVSNISKPLKVEINSKECTLIPHDGGAVWSLMMDDFRLEKSDFKGQSAEDKVISMYEALQDFKPKFDVSSYDEAVSSYTREVVRDTRGPI